MRGRFEHMRGPVTTQPVVHSARVDAESLAPHLFRSLSGGQQQRVLLARALAAEPDLLVLDEPTAGMDIASEAAILEFLRELNRSTGVTILIVTHMLSLVINFAHPSC